MDDDSRPVYGLLQPTSGLGLKVGSLAVKGRRKPPKMFIATTTRRTLTENVRARVEARYKNQRNKVKALAEESGVGRSTIQRVLKPDTYGSVGPSIDTLTQIANALKCEPFELLKSDAP